MLDKKALTLSVNLVQVETTSSTMDDAAKLAKEGAPHLTCVLAEEMTAGRGRRGRHWQTFKGTQILATFIVRQGAGAHLPLVASLAAQKAIKNITGGLPFIKWPNDILIDHKKVVGILVEMVKVDNPQTDTPFQVVSNQVALLGVGINVKTPKEGLSDDFIGTTLEKMCVVPISREEVFNTFVDELQKLLVIYENQGWSALNEPYKKVCMTLGHKVIWQNEDKEIEGIASRLTPDGVLEIVDADGVTHSIHAGDVVLQGLQHV